MKWLYDEKTVSLVFLALVGVGPALAALGSIVHRLLAGQLSRRAGALWVVVAIAGPFNYGLWNLFNAIEDRWGLDRVKPLLINFAIFVSLGIVIGLVLRRLLPPKPTESVPADSGRESDDSAAGGSGS